MTSKQLTKPVRCCSRIRSWHPCHTLELQSTGSRCSPPGSDSISCRDTNHPHNYTSWNLHNHGVITSFFTREAPRSSSSLETAPGNVNVNTPRSPTILTDGALDQVLRQEIVLSMHNSSAPTHSIRDEEEILDFFQANSAASTNDAAKRFNVTQFFAWSVVHNEGKYPFHLKRVHELQQVDKPARVAFCNWALAEPRTVLWTDEATFGRVGLFNTKNEHLWY